MCCLKSEHYLKLKEYFGFELYAIFAFILRYPFYNFANIISMFYSCMKTLFYERFSWALSYITTSNCANSWNLILSVQDSAPLIVFRRFIL